jgi:hypothetical protein
MRAGSVVGSRYKDNKGQIKIMKKLPIIALAIAFAAPSAFAGEGNNGVRHLAEDSAERISTLEGQVAALEGQSSGLAGQVAALEAQVILLMEEQRCHALPQHNVWWTGCDKTGVDLTGFNFTNAILIDVNFTGANLVGAFLGGANMDGADLTNANLYAADIGGTNLPNVIWSNTICPDGSNTDTNGLGYCEPLAP